MTAVIPTIVTSSTAGFQPAFKPVTTKDRHICSLAAIATIASTNIEDVWKRAEELGLPKVGPFYHLIDEHLITALFAKYSWVATVWKESEKPSQLPDLCIALVDYDADWEVGRYVVFHRAKCSHDEKTVEYIIDPTAIRQELVIRTDITTLAPAWYIGVHPMNKTSSPGKK
ncbi:hypothetical protein ABIB42_003772 [Massilia sp. UYP32]|uniref:hypothetical protein n=1 Tax=Massilia sp. UYP32 TaxID=1756386 RepID=UPI003D1CB669